MICAECSQPVTDPDWFVYPVLDRASGNVTGEVAREPFHRACLARAKDRWAAMWEPRG